MTKKLVFLLEEVSAKEFLNGILPKILPPEIDFRCIPFEGKSDLEKVSGSKVISSCLDVNNTRSNSFKVFIEGIKRIAV